MTDIILSKYSVDQSSSFALSKFLSKFVIKSSPLITHPALYTGSINSSAFSFIDESINNVSAAPQISGLLNLLLKIIFLAIIITFNNQSFANDHNFDEWIKNFKIHALKKNISEETFDKSFLNEIKSLYWLVDPLDGTREFINKTDEFTVNIALICDKKAVFGIVASPVKEKIWHGSIFDDNQREESLPDCLRLVMSKSHKSINDEAFLEFLDDRNVKYQRKNIVARS